MPATNNILFGVIILFNFAQTAKGSRFPHLEPKCPTLMCYMWVVSCDVCVSFKSNSSIHYPPFLSRSSEAIANPILTGGGWIRPPFFRCAMFRLNHGFQISDSEKWQSFQSIIFIYISKAPILFMSPNLFSFFLFRSLEVKKYEWRNINILLKH